MKNQNQGLNRLFSWAREAQVNEEFELSPVIRGRVLSVWRQDLSRDLNDGVLAFLKWAVAGSVGIMAISILLNHDYLGPTPSLEADGSPQTVLHSFPAAELYVP